MKKVPDLVPNKIDRDPSVIMGVTGPELYSIAWLSIPAFFFSAILCGIVFGSLPGALFVGFIGVVLTLFGGVMVVARLKNNKPPHYLLHKRLKIQGDLGLKKAPFIYKSTSFRATRD